MAEEEGFQIGKKLYPVPVRFRMGDPILVENLTGWTWAEFSDRYDKLMNPDNEGNDPIVILALLAVSVAREHPTWRRDRVIEYVSELDQDAVVFVAPTAVEEGDAGPPPVTAANGATPPPAEPSRSESATDSSEKSSLPTFGIQTSVTSPE